MKKDDWLFGFLIGVMVVVAEVGYWAHYVGRTSTVFERDTLVTQGALEVQP